MVRSFAPLDPALSALLAARRQQAASLTVNALPF